MRLSDVDTGRLWIEVQVDMDVETFSKDAFEFREARIVGGDKEAGVGVMGGLMGPRWREKGLFGNEG